jgi:serine/threonine protein kinase
MFVVFKFINLNFILSLQFIHNKNLIHRDIHSGNILRGHAVSLIGDLGLSQPANNISSNNEIYGVKKEISLLKIIFLKIRSKIFIKSFYFV